MYVCMYSGLSIFLKWDIQRNVSPKFIDLRAPELCHESSFLWNYRLGRIGTQLRPAPPQPPNSNGKSLFSARTLANFVKFHAMPATITKYIYIMVSVPWWNSGPESCFVFVAFAFEIKVSIILKLQTNEANLTSLWARNCTTIQRFGF